MTFSLMSELTYIFRLMPEGFFLLGLIVIALWREDKAQDFIWLYIAGVATIVVSFHWVPYYPGLTVMMWCLAAYLLLEGVLLMAYGFGAARGLSQFKEWVRRSKRED